MPHRRSRLALGCFVAVAIIDLVAEFAGWHPVSWICRMLLMPLLIWLCWVGAARRTRLLVLVMIALGFSWLGDFAGFTILLKIGFFLVAQILYITAFRPYWRRGLLARPGLLVACCLALAGVIGVAAAAAGPLAVPVAIYGASLALMAVLATGVSRLAGIGGFLFLLSDIVLAVNYFIAPGAIPYGAFVNMSIYLPAQLLIALGTVRAVSTETSEAPDPVA